MKRNTLKCITAAHTTTKGPETPSLVSIFTLQEGLGQSGIPWKYQNLNLNLGSEKSQKNNEMLETAIVLHHDRVEVFKISWSYNDDLTII